MLLYFDTSDLGLVGQYSAIYTDLWGYDTTLTAATIAVTFYVPTL